MSRTISRFFTDIKYKYANKDDISENLRDNSNGYHKFLSFLNLKSFTELPAFCMDYADNYIDLENNIFIGGSRRFDLSNDVGMIDLSNTFKTNLLHKLASFTTGRYNEDVCNSTDFDFSDNSGTNKLHKLFYKEMFSTDRFVDINDLSNFDKAVFLRNKNM